MSTLRREEHLEESCTARGTESLSCENETDVVVVKFGGKPIRLEIEKYDR